jgi:tRNA(Arg) A34 adenosine deaminase TadA
MTSGVDLSNPERTMRYCISLARRAAGSGNYPLASVVVKDGRLLGESASTLISDDFDPSGHPEMVAVRAAAAAERSRYLEGAFLYSTLEPCPMCTSVAVWAKLAGIVFGATLGDAQEFAAQHPDPLYTWRQIDIPAATVVAAGTPRLSLDAGVLRAECRELFGIIRSPSVS